MIRFAKDCCILLLVYPTLERRHMPFLCRFLNRGSMKLRHGKSSTAAANFQRGTGTGKLFYTHQMSGDTVKHVGKFCTTSQGVVAEVYDI